ncbi:hypothetical protein [Polaribacter sp.]|uniref:hypothetical protein n=1 Tax=Polaribacter sp. TaxID=1920175 RepID=UPI003F6B4F4D
MKIHKLLLYFLVATSFCYGQKKYENRALYVDNFATILGSTTLENELLEFSKNHQINTLILYDLHKINKRFHLGDLSKNHLLASFIKKARTEFGIKKLSASGESSNFFIKAIHPYNISRKDKLERFDVYNLEYEYWNEKESLEDGYYCNTYLKNVQLPCNRENSFKYFIQSLFVMKTLAKELDEGIEVEAYIGNFKHTEVKEISEHVDRLLIHDYVKNPNRNFIYIKERLNLLNKINSKIDISVLYSSEMDFMGKWLKDHKLHEAEIKFFKNLEENDISLEKHLNFKGFSYYNYGYLNYVINLHKKRR